MVIRDLGLIDFSAAVALQEQLVTGIASGKEEEILLLMEHHPVYTIGSGGDQANLLDPKVQLLRTNRGGDITFHGPGQLVGYPLLHLSRFDCDLHRYLRFLEEVLLETAASFGVLAKRVNGKTGIWTERGKLASIGIGVRKWVSMHGFALNITGQLDGFAVINPCGMVGCPMTSLERERNRSLQRERVVDVTGKTLLALLPANSLSTRSFPPPCISSVFSYDTLLANPGVPAHQESLSRAPPKHSPAEETPAPT